MACSADAIRRTWLTRTSTDLLNVRANGDVRSSIIFATIKNGGSKKWKEFRHFFRICEMRSDKKRTMNVCALDSVWCGVSRCCLRLLTVTLEAARHVFQ